MASIDRPSPVYVVTRSTIDSFSVAVIARLCSYVANKTFSAPFFSMSLGIAATIGALQGVITYYSSTNSRLVSYALAVLITHALGFAFFSSEAVLLGLGIALLRT